MKAGVRCTMVALWVVGLGAGIGVGACQHRQAKAPGNAADNTAAPPPDAPVEAQVEAQLMAAVDHATATTGDIITYTVEAQYQPHITVDVPEPGSGIAGLRIVDIGRDPIKTVGPLIHERRWYKLRADLVGSYVLPAVQGSWHVSADPNGPHHTLHSPEIFLEVKSVLPQDGSTQDVRDIEALEPMPSKRRWIWFVAAGVGGLLLIAAGLWWWQRQRRRHVAAPLLPPHEVAFAALNRLRKTDFNDAKAVRRYYFAISDVVRAYVEARYTLNATDLTSEEIFARLAELPTLGVGERTILRAFLTETDRVKYTGETPDSRHVASTYEQALSFVEATRPAPPNPGAASGVPPVPPTPPSPSEAPAPSASNTASEGA